MSDNKKLVGKKRGRPAKVKADHDHKQRHQALNERHRGLIDGINKEMAKKNHLLVANALRESIRDLEMCHTKNIELMRVVEQPPYKLKPFIDLLKPEIFEEWQENEKMQSEIWQKIIEMEPKETQKAQQQHLDLLMMVQK